MTNTSAIWLSENDVSSLVSVQDTIGALEQGLRALGSGDGFNIAKASPVASSRARLVRVETCLPRATTPPGGIMVRESQPSRLTVHSRSLMRPISAAKAA